MINQRRADGNTRDVFTSVKRKHRERRYRNVRLKTHVLIREDVKVPRIDRDILPGGRVSGRRGEEMRARTYTKDWDVPVQEEQDGRHGPWVLPNPPVFFAEGQEEVVVQDD